MSIKSNLIKIKESLPTHVTLVAVTKTKSVADIQEAYDAGHRIFGENKVQEMTEKWESLPKDIEWHMIGHLQRNKVKYMAPFVSLVHGVDSLRLLKEINKRAKQNDRVIPCLLQVHIAEESSKFGFDENELIDLISSGNLESLEHIEIKGLMGMATFTEDTQQISNEFRTLKKLFDRAKTYLPNLKEISMGMSGDYKIAIEEGSTMVRLGSSIFGARN
ncbi:YggS family pyridoxal phosphate-dependent enzyme [Arenibacter amylolyticus]|uniref:YggS family pyridoxal phosphate-dependent enzyme n=1 Tax=Arenibacter amylolyticus TaxID=1406873 RepID=UPI000A395CB9|nr:YggS family pyridoxal phosphate-dependent enzyme [Arenibacter amylolyticus]